MLEEVVVSGTAVAENHQHNCDAAKGVILSIKCNSLGRFGICLPTEAVEALQAGSFGRLGRCLHFIVRILIVLRSQGRRCSRRWMVIATSCTLSPGHVFRVSDPPSLECPHQTDQNEHEQDQGYRRHP